jgi:hypothetical protein
VQENALRASGIARRRTEEKRAEVFFPLRATTTAADSKRDARAVQEKGSSRLVAKAYQRVLDHFGHCGVDPVLAAGDLRRWLLEAHRLDQRLNQ